MTDIPTIRYNKGPMPRGLSGIFLIAVPMEGFAHLTEDIAVMYWGPNEGDMRLHKLDGVSFYDGPVVGWIGPIERVRIGLNAKLPTLKTDILDV